MAEKTAAELLTLQFEHDLAQARADLYCQFFASGLAVDPLLIDAIDQYVERKLKLWWISRMGHSKDSPNPEELQKRIQERTELLAKTTMVMLSGRSVDGFQLQMGLLGLTADISALWGFLIELGLTTPELRQQYLNASINSLSATVHEQSQKIMVASGGRG